MSHDRQLVEALAFLKRGQLADAEAICRARLEQFSRDAATLHVLGLIRENAGDLVESERLMRESIDVEPHRAGFRASLAHLLRRLGRMKAAELTYREALGLDPAYRLARLGLARTLDDLGDPGAAESECRVLLASNRGDGHAWTALARALWNQNRLAEAETAYRNAIESQPAYAPAHQNLGAFLIQGHRAEEALASLTRAETLGARGFEPAFNRGRTLLSLYRIDDAEQAFAEAVSFEPRNAAAQMRLASVRFMRGDADYVRDFATAAAAHREDPGLQTGYASILQQVGELPAAEALLREALARDGASPQVRSGLAEVLCESGRLKEAEKEALEAATATPNDPSIVETLVAILLARGKPADAEPFVRAQRERDPLDQTWIAWEATAARLLGQARYRELYDYARLVRSYTLEPPRGWSSLADLNAALAKALEARHAFANHPLDPRLRNGSLTVRNLVTERDPAIRAILTAFEGPIEAYRQVIGTDTSHPFSARNKGRAHLANAWSVQLRRAGVHLNHVRPDGWISAVYYVSVPQEVADVSLMSGWIRFGEPRVPVPGALPECFIKPQSGVLVLFPSYIWHGTSPLRGPEPLTTIGFDAVPAQG